MDSWEVYGRLCRDWNYKPWEVRRLTTKQVDWLLSRQPPDKKAAPVPAKEETEEDVRQFCRKLLRRGISRDQSLTPEEWIETKVAKWRAEKEAANGEKVVSSTA